MHYLIGRDLDGDGRYEFIQDMANMILTEDPYRALQVSEYDLTAIDMAYLNEFGFYALEADRFQVSLLERLLFRPITRGFRPPVAPPPRRGVRRPLLPRPRYRSMLGAVPHPPKAPRAPKPRRHASRPIIGGGPAHPGMPSRKPGGRGPGGPGGRGFGR